ncbi:DUF2249 domain-containing protein [Ornithinimicrobium murale]|uniref:DUF2249 domain-containing protein n=1 Tax=Ornithinimicrobium murale TaxID=1050153 RepID=UPI000E0DB20A|nr:DUF2249 domain-containing protein [Ornithinimicrobium murale]
MTSEIPLQDVSGCACGEHAGDVPELDVRTVPHAIRHATVFGALSAIGVGGAMDLVAPHDPKLLLAQIADREDGAIDVEYLVPGPEAWTLRLTRTR